MRRGPVYSVRKN